VSDDASLAKYCAAVPNPADRVLYYQTPGCPHPAITAAEEVSFVPHPKTMTMAGEWEYFAAGSQHPFPYAIAELIDNSLRATRNNTASRRIVITLVSAASAPAGLVSVWDNGCGMSLRQLSEWAVMNLTMEDRGQKPQEMDRPRQTQGGAASKQLCSDLSYFGVGSKNAAFFMGRAIRLMSKGEGNTLVHELAISADALEARYKEALDQARAADRAPWCFVNVAATPPRGACSAFARYVHRICCLPKQRKLRLPAAAAASVVSAVQCAHRCTRSASTSACQARPAQRPPKSTRSASWAPGQPKRPPAAAWAMAPRYLLTRSRGSWCLTSSRTSCSSSGTPPRRTCAGSWRTCTTTTCMGLTATLAQVRSS
jgi:Histidine kinase-, DNA gyrase B-, and HSP90-like ATPase